MTRLRLLSGRADAHRSSSGARVGRPRWTSKESSHPAGSRPSPLSYKVRSLPGLGWPAALCTRGPSASKRVGVAPLLPLVVPRVVIRADRNAPTGLHTCLNCQDDTRQQDAGHGYRLSCPDGARDVLRSQPAPLRCVGVRLADSEPVDGPPSSAHDEQKSGRRTIWPALRAGRAFARFPENQVAATPPFHISTQRTLQLTRGYLRFTPSGQSAAVLGH